MQFFPVAVLLFIVDTIAVPVPTVQDVDDETSSSAVSAESSDLNVLLTLNGLVGSDNESADSEQAQVDRNVLQKRSPEMIPDVDLCRQHKNTRNSDEVNGEDAYERYFHIEKPYNSELRRKRQPVDNNSSSQEFSKEKGGQVNDSSSEKEGSDGTRTKRGTEANSSSQENSSEEDSSKIAVAAKVTSAIEKPSEGTDGARRRRKVAESSSQEDSSEEKLKQGANGLNGSGETKAAVGAKGAKQGTEANSSSQENSSEEGSGKIVVGAKGESASDHEKSSDGTVGAHRKRNANVDSSPEHSSEEQGKHGTIGAKVAEIEDGADATRRKRNLDKNTISVEIKDESNVVLDTESEENVESNEVIKSKKDSSLEDYVQGCEVMEVNSDEANETPYIEDRRKRSPGDAAQSNAVHKQVLQPLVGDTRVKVEDEDSLLNRRRRAVNSDDAASNESVDVHKGSKHAVQESVACDCVAKD